MAEVTGLVIGVVGLASLFNTCIDLFDRFELGVRHIEGYRLACEKVDLLKLRLDHWGETCGIGLHGPALSALLDERREVVSRCLAEIHAILESASALVAKYRLVPWRQRDSEASIPNCIDRSSKTALQISLNLNAIRGLVGLRKRTLWAVHDKQRLDALIQDLSFLIDNLEKVSTSSMPCAPETVFTYHTYSKQPPGSQASQALTKVVRTDSSAETAQQSPTTPKPGNRTRAPDNPQIFSNFSSVYTNDQANKDGSIGIMGNVVGGSQNTESRSIYFGRQDNDASLGVMGNVGSDVLTSWRASEKHRNDKAASN